MVPVIIAANSQEKKFWGALQNILNRNFKTVQCIGGYVDVRDDNAELFITDAHNLDFISSNNAILVFKDFTKLKVRFGNDCNKLAIVDSADNDAMRHVSMTKLPAITCGLFPRDSITLSSIKEDSAVIGLQRCMTCFDGTTVEPQEIPVSLFSPVENFVLLCAAAIFILTGNINKLLKVKI